MSLDFYQVRQQVNELGQIAAAQEGRLQALRQSALEAIERFAADLDLLRDKVTQIAQHHDPNLRCAAPLDERLNAHFVAGPPPEDAIILAADGSQISPDRHIQVNYGLINVGAIAMRNGSPVQPHSSVHSRLIYGEQVENISEASLALQRDLGERRTLAEQAQTYRSQTSEGDMPIITFTDGPIELWVSRQANTEEATSFQKQIEEYLQILEQLRDLGAITAGYIDKPAANLVVRLLEVALSEQQNWDDFRNYHPLRGVSDRSIFERLLAPGERSAVFSLQSQTAKTYQGDFALRFFYLNVSADQEPSLARVEIPAWVAGSAELVDNLQAALVGQCRLLRNRPYPYLLHRAHETAVVSLQEKEQVTQMIVQEMLRRGIAVGRISQKQNLKNLRGRTRR